eukprot:TRINITY_DN240_c0_g1_i4.p1 TRINITY_DN240_c0_g1~~TRINITY_DN240_c0_g1_i4.p1  ORF type:complete len:602 (-),score=156.97 TRINITY_DN240_c0_g1_i4:75-1880(-)
MVLCPSLLQCGCLALFIIAGSLLRNAVQDLNGIVEERVRKADGVTISFDSWTNIRKEQLMAIVLTTSDKKQVMAHKAVDVSDVRKDAETVLLHVMEEIDIVENMWHSAVFAVVSDDAGECRKARRLIREQRPDIITLPCFSHQFHLLVGDYIKADGSGKVVIGQVVDVAGWFLSHSVPYAMLRKQELAMPQYKNRTVALQLPGKTRWGSHYTAVNQLLKSQRALQALALSEYDKLVDTVGARADAKTKARKVLDTVTDSNFWTSLNQARRHLGPLLIAIRAVEGDSATLDTALFMCAAIYQGFGEIADGAVRAVLTAKLETRFAAYNQPAMVLAYYLNPARQDKTPLNTAGALTNTANLVVLAKDLYQQLCRDTADSDAITEQMLLYSERKEPFQIGVIESFCRPRRGQTSDPTQLWRAVRGRAPQLAKLALRLYGVCINAAGDERFFSQTGLTHTKIRNRLGQGVVTDIARVKAELNGNQRKRARKEVTVVGDASQEVPAAEQAEAQDEPAGDAIDEDTVASSSEWFDAIEGLMEEWEINEQLSTDDAHPTQAAAAGSEATAEAACVHVRTTMTGSAPLATIITEIIGSLDEFVADEEGI